MKNTLKSFLVIILIIGFVLLFLTITQGFHEYSKINYQDNLKKLLTYKFGSNVTYVCNDKTFHYVYAINNHKNIYLDDPKSIQKISLTLIPKNEVKSVHSISYDMLSVLAYDINKSGNSISVVSNIVEPFFFCKYFPPDYFLIKIDNLSKVLDCANDSELVTNYNLKCLRWNDKNNKMVTGFFGERLTCDYNVIKTNDCSDYVLINSTDIINDYVHECKAMCFKKSAKYVCTSVESSLLKNYVFKMFDFLKKNSASYLSVYSSQNKLFDYLPDEITDYSNKLSSDLTLAKSTNDNSLFVEYSNLLANFENIYHTAYGDDGSLLKKSHYKKMLFYFTNTLLPSQAVCDVYRQKNIFAYIIQLGPKNVIGLQHPGCIYVTLKNDDLNSLNYFLDSLYDDETQKLIVPSHVRVQMNPNMPEFFNLGPLKSSRTINITMTPSLVGLPINVFVNGELKINMTVFRKVCTLQSEK